jgi:phage terminase large subunit
MTSAQVLPAPVAQFPEKLDFLFEPHRYKVPYGGRGGAKSWGIARALLLQGAERTLRILCARETQKSIAESVHKLLSDQIVALGLEAFYTVQKATITGLNGTQFIFAGIRQNVSNLKSYEGCDICWVEEAQNVSKHSWDVLIPTIRKAGSEIWASFNPDLASDDTYRRFVTSPPPSAKVVKVNWRDNPWFTDELREEMEHLRETDPDSYEHVYEGMCKLVVEGAIYRNELLAAEKEGRICRVPWDSARPVDTFWDLGFADNTSIWFAQSVGFEFHLIDYLSGSQQALSFYLKAIKDKPYAYGHHHLPHDAKAHELGSGRSIEEQVRAFGLPVRIVKKLAISDGIAAARSIFHKCWFDAEKCADGLQGLRHYRYEVDEDLKTLMRLPLHDWASHPADGFRYFAVGIKEPEKQKPNTPSKSYIRPGSAFR